jgi:foldase protein PrsA
MDMKTLRFLLLPLLLAGIAALAAGCGGGGGGSSAVPADAVALVGSTPVTKTQFDLLMSAAQGEDKVRGQAFPKVGTAAYTQLRDQAVAYLVQGEELAQQGSKLGVTVTQKDIDARLQQIAKQYYKGSRKKLLAGLKSSGLTLPQAEQQLRISLLAQRINTKVTSTVKVTPAAVKQYYQQNKATYTMPQTREVRHILVSSKSLAETLETKLRNGASFAALAKKYSKDTTTGAQGGKLCVAHGSNAGACTQTVPPFDKVAFALKTHQISAPVHSQYGWHIIQALGPVVPAHTQSFAKVKNQIRANLLQSRQGVVWANWLAKMKKNFDGKVSYQSGYQPAATTATVPTTPATTGTTSATTTG